MWYYLDADLLRTWSHDLLRFQWLPLNKKLVVFSGMHPTNTWDPILNDVLLKDLIKVIFMAKVIEKNEEV